jgi:hypothetical protein
MVRPGNGMQTKNKRAWLYSGLAMAPGVVMVRRQATDERKPRTIVPAASRPVFLVGDRVAASIEPFLRQLMADAQRRLTRVPLSALSQTNTSSGSYVVLCDLPTEVIAVVAPEVKRKGARVVTVPTLEHLTAPKPKEGTPRGFESAARTLSAAQCAAIAGRVWTYIR